MGSLDCTRELLDLEPEVGMDYVQPEVDQAGVVHHVVVHVTDDVAEQLVKFLEFLDSDLLDLKQLMLAIIDRVQLFVQLPAVVQT